MLNKLSHDQTAKSIDELTETLDKIMKPKAVIGEAIESQIKEYNAKLEEEKSLKRQMKIRTEEQQHVKELNKNIARNRRDVIPIDYNNVQSPE